MCRVCCNSIQTCLTPSSFLVGSDAKNALPTRDGETRMNYRVFCQTVSCVLLNQMRGGEKMICRNCGNNASWRDPNCNKCDDSLHQKNCKSKSPDCKCHKINENMWLSKKSKEQYV